MSDAVLLLAHGSPDSPDQMAEFLRRIMRREPRPQLVAEMQERYRRVGGRSPLLEITRRQAAALQQAVGLPVHVGMLHWHPLIADVAREIRADRIVALPMAPHGGPYGAEKYLRALDGFPVVPIRSWATDPRLVRAWVGRLDDATADGAVLLFTAHSVPVECGPYAAEVRATAEAIVELLGDVPWELAWQSRSPAPGAWLEPDVDTKLAELAARDARRVVVAPIGFVCDHMEILYDLDVVHRATAERLGIEWRRVPMLNDAPMLIDALAGLVRAAL
jgi:ferrochelatase